MISSVRDCLFIRQLWATCTFHLYLRENMNWRMLQSTNVFIPLLCAWSLASSANPTNSPAHCTMHILLYLHTVYYLELVYLYISISNRYLSLLSFSTTLIACSITFNYTYHVCVTNKPLNPWMWSNIQSLCVFLKPLVLP